MDNIEKFYQTKLLKCGFSEESFNRTYGPLGTVYRVQDGMGEGIYWVYGQKNLYDIKIHDFFIFEDGFLEFDLPECLSITYYESISGEEIMPYRRLSAGCIKTAIGGYAPYKAIIHKKVPIKSIGVEIMPEYYEKYLREAFPDEQVSPYDAFRTIDQTSNFPEMVSLLWQIQNYKGDGIAAKLFYEGKVAEVVSLVLEYNKKNNSKIDVKLTNEDIKLFNNVAAYINDHFAYELPLENLARIACMGTTKLKRGFKQVHGCSISEYIQERRLSHAETLLTTTNLPIGQVAKSVGFSNPGRFSEVFRKNTGILPKEYRRIVAN